MNETTKSLLIGAAIAGVMGLNATSAIARAKKSNMCVGGNACSGQSACKMGKNNSCAGKNGCKGQGGVKEKDATKCKALQAANSAAPVTPAPGTQTPKAN